MAKVVVAPVARVRTAGTTVLGRMKSQFLTNPGNSGLGRVVDY